MGLMPTSKPRRDWPGLVKTFERHKGELVDVTFSLKGKEWTFRKRRLAGLFKSAAGIYTLLIRKYSICFFSTNEIIIRVVLVDRYGRFLETLYSFDLRGMGAKTQEEAETLTREYFG